MEGVIWQHGERWPWAAAAVLAGWIVVAMGYRGGRSGLRGGRKLVAAGSKALFVLVMGALICDPVRVRRELQRGANEVVLAVESAQRLKLSLRRGEAGAAERVREACAPEASWLREVEESFRVSRVALGERMRRVDTMEEVRFDSALPAVVGAVKSMRQGGVARRLAAVVLFSDGNAADLERLGEMAAEGVPVFPVMATEQVPEKDLSIGKVRVLQTPFEDTAVTMDAVVRGIGYGGKKVSVVVLAEDGRQLAEESVTLRADDAAQGVRLVLPGLRAGLTLVRVVVVADELKGDVVGDGWREKTGEVTEVNNEWRAMVDRGEGPYRVLYVAGRPNWEYKFLRRALRADDEVQLPALVRIAKREPKFEWRGREGETSNPLFRGFGAAGEEAQRYDEPVLVRLETRDAKELADGFPKVPEELMADYRALVVDDLEAAFFSTEQMRLVERFVTERGGTLILLGGQESYREGGYEGSVMGRMMPVSLEALSTAGPMRDARLEWSREGMLEPWMRLRADEEAERVRLSGMPGFYAVNQVHSIKPGAALLATVTDGTGQKVPAVVAQRLGEGRVLSVLVADLWRWGMRDEAGREDLEKWWRQVLRWAVVDVPDAVELEVAESAVGGGRTVTVRVRDERFEAMDEAEVELRVKAFGEVDGPSERLHAAPSEAEPGVFEAEYSGRREAAMEVEAVVHRRTGEEVEVVGTISTGWVDNPLAESMAELTPNRAAMEQLAKATGGGVYGMGELRALAEHLGRLDAPVMDQRVEPLWHLPWVFGGLLGMLMTEWWLRRKGGQL